MAPRDWPRFFHFLVFDGQWDDLALTDDDLAGLQQEIGEDPTRYPPEPGTNGLRKVRVARQGQGKRGGFRVGYAHFPEQNRLALVRVWGKTQKSPLNPAEKRVVADALRDLKQALDEGKIR